MTVLPTPTARDWKNVGDPAKTAGRMAERGQPLGEGKTPEAWDEWTAKMKAAHGNGNGHGASLSIEAQRLLPTPNAADAWVPEGVTENTMRRGDPNGTLRTTSGSLPKDVALHADRWGQYAAAIARWEHLTRPAPPPTETSAKGTPRLSAAFSEWLMGLPAGWVTDVPGITRNEALKALGNGVVPAQAAAALRILLGGEAAAAPKPVGALLPTVKASNNENRQSLDRYGMNLGQALGVTPLEAR